MTASTVYDVFLVLPEMEKQCHITLVNEYNRKNNPEHAILFQKKKKEFAYTKQDAMDYLLKNVFTSKKSIHKL